MSRTAVGGELDYSDLQIRHGACALGSLRYHRVIPEHVLLSEEALSFHLGACR
jgi:hypothetical protein